MVTRKAYVPDRGDIIWVNFDPTRGHEQSGKRPAVVLSSKIYNQPAHLLVACPISSKTKGYPYEVSISGKISGVALADHVRSLDWKERPVKKAGRVSEAELLEIQKKLKTLLL
jgi:mRNA interferase MazF